MSNGNEKETETATNKKRRTFLKATGGAVTATAFAGCAFLSGGDGGDDETITIASLQPFSGGFAPWGNAHSEGLEFAVEEINNDGGVLGRDLEIVEGDTGGDPSEADNLFRQHVEQEGAVAAVGPVSSDVGIRSRETATQLEVPLILHMAGSHRILPKDARYTFRLGSHSAPTDMGSVMGMVEQEGFTNIGAIIGDYEWGRSVETTIGQLLPDGVDLTMEVASLGEEDFTPFIRNLPDDMDLLLASGHPPGSPAIHAQARELGYEHAYTVGAGIPPAVLQQALGELAGTFAHQHVSDPYGDHFQSVAGRFVEERGERFDTHEAYGYASAEIIAQAIEAADSTDPGDIAEGMRTTEIETMLRNPVDYVEYGEVNNLIHMLSTIEPEAPEYNPDAEWRLNPLFQSDPLPAFDPDEWDFDS